MAADHRFQVAAELAIESRIRAALLRQTTRLREQTEVRRSRTNHRHSFGISFNHDFGPGAHACQERRQVVRRFGLGDANRLLGHRYFALGQAR